MNCGDHGIALIKEFEGLACQQYADVGGLPTIGYGHRVRAGEAFSTIDDAEATRLLRDDLKVAEACIAAAVTAPLAQHQFDALCSFVYNLGCSRLHASTLLRKLNAGDYAGAAIEFPKWCRVGVNAVDGLLRRRLAEQLLFNTP